MQSRLYLAAATLASSVIGGPAALAADMPLKAPRTAAAQVWDWTGFYGGLHAGYGWTRTGSTITLSPAEIGNGAGDPTFGPLPGGPRADGFIGGGQFGFNARFNNLLAGIEADLSYADIDGKSSATGELFIGGIYYTALETKIDWFGTVRARLGVLPAENLLLYATGGVAFGGVKTALTATNLTGCGGGASYCTPGASSTSSVGWTIGGGAELAIAPAWSLKVEYLHVDFGSKSMTAPDPETVGGWVSATTKVRANVVRGGLNYHF